MFKAIFLWCIIETALAANQAGRYTVLLSAAGEDNTYYNGEKNNRYYDIIDFHASYSRILQANGVNVVIACDHNTCNLLSDKGVGDDILWEKKLEDIWMRDPTRVNPKVQAGFGFEPNYIPKEDAKVIVNTFDSAVREAGIQLSPRSEYVLDGGNVVDNYKDAAIVTSRFLAENPESFANEDDAKNKLGEILGYDFVSILPQIVGDTTGHSDGMVSFIDDYTVAYSIFADDTIDENGDKAKVSMVAAMKNDLGPDFTLVGLKYHYPAGNSRDTEGYKGFTSGCGTHINSLLAGDVLFVPTFGQDPENVKDNLTPEADREIVDKIIAHTDKKVVEVPMPKRVCEIGGNVRCLSWLLAPKEGNLLIQHVAGQKRK